MHNGDVLGDEGRKALNACVKVKIFGKPETRKYDREAALKRLRGCCGNIWSRCAAWWCFDELVLPSDKHGNSKSYDIVDIQHALVNFDERRCVEKYPKEGPEFVKLRDLIDKRRADVEREYKEADPDPEGRRKYSWVVAQRRVRDCFAGNFAEDRWTLSKPNDSYNIIDIYEAFVRWDKIREIAEAKRAALEKEYAEATTAVCFEGKGKLTLPKYSGGEALNRIGDCYYDDLRVWQHDISPIKLDERGMPETTRSYDIFDIHKVFLQFGGEKLLEKYPEGGPGSDELKKLIDAHRADLEEEYQKAKSHEGSNRSLPEYTSSEAERRLRDCFAGTFISDTEIFPKKEKDESEQTYDIVDIKKAIDYFDTRTFLDAFKYPSEQEPGYVESKQKVDEQRASLQKECDEATSNIEIEHGSGFIVHDHFIITNKHVIETHLNETESHEIRISNAITGELPCKVAHYDAGKDLALLYCPGLNLEQCGICPLQLSNLSLLPGMSIFSFGYPISHTEETALFVSGNVSGSKKTLAGHSMVVLNCSLNSGNSGGPVVCWVNGQLKVVGVATQKHFKEILTLEERQTIEKIRKSLETHAIPDLPDFVKNSPFPQMYYYSDPKNCQTPVFLLTLKLYDALETHSQFNLSNALPGNLVVEFIKNSIGEFEGEHKEELGEVVELAQDRVNILPSGHLSASQCCIQ